MNAADLVAPLAGGALIGLGAGLLFLLNGRIAGVSGIVGGLFSPKPGEVGWRAAFVGGLLLAGVALPPLLPHAFDNPTNRSYPALIAAGLLVGIGTRLGNGCTSGHGVCGVARLSRRSMAATLTFMAAGGLAATAFGYLMGGTP